MVIVCASRPVFATAEAASAGVDAVRRGPIDVARRALLEFEAGHFDRALEAFEEAAPLGLANRDRFDLLRAESLLHLGRAGEAITALSVWRAAYPNSPWRHRALFRQGDAQSAAGDLTAALSTWTAALSTYPEYPARGAVWLAMADVELRLGHPVEAQRWALRVVSTFPGDPVSASAALFVSRVFPQEATSTLAPTRLASPEERLSTGADLRKRKRFREAVAMFVALASDGTAAKALRADARWHKARTLWESGEFKEALVDFQALKGVAEAAGDTRHLRRCHRWIGYTLERLGRTDEAALSLALASGNAETPPQPVVEDIAWLYFNAGAYKKSEPWFARLRKTSAGPSIHWIRTWLDYRLGRFELAAKAFLSMPGDRSRYWAARAWQGAREKVKAVDLFRAISRGAPTGYYGYQAQARLRELGEPVAELEAEAPGSGPSDGGQKLVPRETGLSALAALFGSTFPQLSQAAELEALGEPFAAAVSLRAVSDELRAFRDARPRGKALKTWTHVYRPYVDNRGDTQRAEWGRTIVPAVERALVPSDLSRGAGLARAVSSDLSKRLGQAFAALGDPHYARRHGFIGALPRNLPEDVGSKPDWKRRYPLPFTEVVERNAKHYGLDPLLLFAFMTVESSWNPLAISRSNARGLMQVMPHTGGLIAERLGLRNFGSVLLFEPEVVLEMSAWYIHELLHKFKGQAPLAIASYNAGPHRVGAWLARKPTLPLDELIEEIPYDEAREYTKKVIRFWGLYRRIYVGTPGRLFDQKVDGEMRDNINF